MQPSHSSSAGVLRRSCGLLALLLAALPATARQGLPSFPGAEGFGAAATGGRGGDVHIVTTLAADGPGSLQWAVDQPGPRIVVFEVSGVIEGDLHIPHGDLTIAGQTATGAGITIHGHVYTTYGQPYGNLVLRHLRIRPPDPDANWPFAQHDAIQFSTNHTIMLDHIDASHAADEIVDLWNGASGITIQWSAITHPIHDPASGWDHPKGVINHRSCADSGTCPPCVGDGTCTAADVVGGRISVHHNLFVHARNRTPALSTGPADVVNNVVYNGREGFVHHNIANGDFNIVGNVFRDGPSAILAPLWFDPENPMPPIPTRYRAIDNRVDDPGVFVGVVGDPWQDVDFADAYTFACCGIGSGQFDDTTLFDFTDAAYGAPGYVPITTHPSAEVLSRVLGTAGAHPRDVVGGWAVDDVLGRSGAWGNRRPTDWLEGLEPGTPPPDADRDGMADDWELLHALDPSDGADHTTVMPSGYTAIEEYLNGLAARLVDEPVFADGFESGDTTAWGESSG